MTSYHDGKPLFIDPIAVSDGADVDDVPVPVWFRLLAVTLLALAVYYLFAFLDGPRLSGNHNFVPGRTAYEDAQPVPSASPAP